MARIADRVKKELSELTPQERELAIKALRDAVYEGMALDAVTSDPNRVDACVRCGSVHIIRKGHGRDGSQRWKCVDCDRTFGVRTNRVMGMSKLKTGVWMRFLECFVDCLSLRKGGNVAMALVRKDTYLTLLPERYLRPYDPHFVTPDEFRHELNMIGENIDTAYAMDNELSANPSEPEEYQVRNQPVKDILDCLSGNTGLTEELIYNMSDVSGPRYEVLTASTQSDTAMGSIPQCNLPTSNGQIRPLKTFSDKEGLLVVRKGKAGGTRYLPKGNYAINDDAYILSVKDDCPYQIDLRWFAIAYKSEFLAYASNSDNGTWNKTGFFESVTIDIPSPKTQQALIQTVDKAQKLAEQLELAQRKLNILLNKEIDRPVSNM